MASKTALSLAFIEHQPQSAARALGAMDAIDAAALLDAIPTRYGAKALSRMPSWPAAQILARVSPEASAVLLQEIAYQDATSILRLLAEDLRRLLLDAMPANPRKDFESSLSFPDDTVGARMTPRILAIEKTQAIADALALVKRSPAEGPQTVYVVSEDRKLIGVVDIAEMLRYRRSVPLGDIMRPAPTGLSARARLHTIGELDAWQEAIYLPVLSRRKHLIGAISRRSAQRGNPVTPTNRPQDSIVGALVEAFFVTGSGLAQLFIDAGEPGSRRR